MPTTLPWGESITVLCELGFIVRKFTLDASTLDGDDVLDGTLDGVDISAYVQNLNINRGRSDEFSAFRAGSAGVALVNNDRRFDPINEASPYWDVAQGKSGVTPRRKLVIASGDNVLFTGRLADVDVDYDHHLSTVTFQAADEFALLASTAISADVTPASELSGARVEAILDRPEVNYPADTRAIDAGTATLGDQVINANTNTLAYLQTVAATEQGLFYAAADGTLTFTDRLTTQFATPVATFTDAGGGIPYRTISTKYGQEFQYNRVQVTREGGVTQSADVAASQAEYGVSTLALDNLLFDDDTQSADLADTLVNLYAYPEYRFTDLTIALHALAAADRAIVNGIELGDIVTVERTFAVGSPASVSEEYAIGGIQHRIGVNIHDVVLRLATAQLVFQFVLDDASFGTLDTDNALAA
jgi:hypothetical protein